MKNSQNLILSLILIIPVFLGFSVESNGNIVRNYSINDTIKIPQKGIVYLYRVGRAVGAIVKTQIKIDGKDAGGLGNNSYFEWDLEPGSYIFTCFTKESSPAIEIDVKPNEKYYIRQDQRIGLTNGGRVTLKEVSESKGLQEMRKAKKLISSYK